MPQDKAVPLKSESTMIVDGPLLASGSSTLCVITAQDSTNKLNYHKAGFARPSTTGSHNDAGLIPRFDDGVKPLVGVIVYCTP